MSICNTLIILINCKIKSPSLIKSPQHTTNLVLAQYWIRSTSIITSLKRPMGLTDFYLLHILFGFWNRILQQSPSIWSCIMWFEQSLLKYCNFSQLYFFISFRDSFKFPQFHRLCENHRNSLIFYAHKISFSMIYFCCTKKVVRILIAFPGETQKKFREKLWFRYEKRDLQREKKKNGGGYGNTGCGVFKWGIQNWKHFWQRNNIPKGYYWILSFGLMASCQKVPKFDFQSQFSMPKIIQIFLKSSLLKSTNLEPKFLLLTFLNHFISKMMPYSWQLAINPKLKTQ